ncbi:hypothetical protein PENTCL1PPCAC_27412, partial [Pristionchus entomophagus]
FSSCHGFAVWDGVGGWSCACFSSFWFSWWLIWMILRILLFHLMRIDKQGKGGGMMQAVSSSEPSSAYREGISSR